MDNFSYEIQTHDGDEWNYWDKHTNPKSLALACNELGLKGKEVKIIVHDLELEGMVAPDLCKEHCKWKGKMMYYMAAEGPQWTAESGARNQAEREFKKYDKEIERRKIKYEWDKSSGKLETVYMYENDLLNREIYRG